ncbi:hypothetical protein MLD38_031388 [Melastoma candidum]|uniref:Uncharacterized protein n=1 Tax=Melastoma candidum TaxID=119954 RepID=A0ACB9MPI7_9MYRT|nr:hypothetical protein MLD38_031388 [Melastoma candidum]
MGPIHDGVDGLSDTATQGAVLPLPPPPPPYPATTTSGERTKGSLGDGGVSMASRDLLSDRLFDEGYKADVKIYSTGGGIVYAHANILGMASPVFRGMMKKSKKQGRFQILTVGGVPHDAVRGFIRFLYSSRYEKEDMEEFVLHLLVLSHVYVVPQLKRLCEYHLERGMINMENVVDVFQLALLCDASRLGFVCHRTIMRNFKEVSATEGWTAMKKSHPILEKLLVEYLVEEDNLRKERIRKSKERKIYLQLYEAMEALVHICRDGCRTIGPHDKAFRKDHPPCSFEACKGLELLVRHFAGCKLRAMGGCVHCRRMWQVLELHSRLCADPGTCRVPLCRNFKDRIRKQNKKDEMKWKILTRKILRTKTIGGGPFFSAAQLL